MAPIAAGTDHLLVQRNLDTTGMPPEDVSFWQAVHAGPRPWSADFY